MDANIFRNIAKSNLGKMITPPTASTTNGRLRKCIPFVTAREYIQELFSTGNGKPVEDTAASIERSNDGELLPTKTSASQETYYVKLQRQAPIDRLYSLQEESPRRGLGAAKLILSDAKERQAGLPETDEAAGLQRTEDGQVVPKAESVAQSMLQRPAPSDVCALRTRLAVC